MATLQEDPPRDQLWLLEMAPIVLATYAWLDEPDPAFDFVEKSMDRFSPVHFVYLKNNPAFDAYSKLPRYRKLETRYEAWKAQQPS